SQKGGRLRIFGPGRPRPHVSARLPAVGDSCWIGTSIPAARAASRRVLVAQGIGQRRKDVDIPGLALPRIRRHARVTALLNLILFVLALPAAAVSLYLLLFTLLSRAPPAALRSSRRLRFDVVVPAHDEALAIEGVVANLRKLDWPADGFRVLVVADNCTDTTAALARAAGAEVLERNDPTRRGKGYALAFAFHTSQAHGWADA